MNSILEEAELETLNRALETLRKNWTSLGKGQREKALRTLSKISITPSVREEVTGFNCADAEGCRLDIKPKFTASTLGKTVDLSPSTIRNFENGTCIPDPSKRSHELYIEWLSEQGYEPDAALMKKYHGNRPGKR